MKRPPRVLFRVAAGPRIGFGHLMRCRALARALGTRPVVSVRGSVFTRATVRDLGCLVRSRDDRALTAVDVLVIDDPSAARAHVWLRRARCAGLSTATIHDGQVGVAEGDLVVDGSITVGGRCHDGGLLLGTRFTILDPRVVNARARRARRRRAGTRCRVLIALGGGSHVFPVVRPLVHRIARLCPDASVVVAAGFSRSRRCSPLGAARWIRRRNGLARDLAACDVAVVAGGLTLYEACAVGVPAVGLAVVPAQRKAIAAFAAFGALVDAGSCADGSAALERAAEGVARSLANNVAADRRSGRARRLVDGRGAARVAAKIRSLAERPRQRRANHA